MSAALFTHAAMVRHSNSARHPEKPERLGAVLDALDDAGLGKNRFEAPKVSRAALQRVHPDLYIDHVLKSEPAEGRIKLDPDTGMAPGSAEAALRAAGAGVAAVEALARGAFDRAFCAVRPPGHHAEPEQAMGFCLFSNIAITARAAQAAGFARIGVIDFDVHHGNGTQAVFENDPTVFFGSIHQSPLYPNTGAESETGLGNIVNATVAPGAPREAWRKTFEGRLVSALDAFAPDLVLISAGFDAHRADPLSEQALEESDFSGATRAVIAVARLRCKGRVVSSLEGGYDLGALGRSAAAHMAALSEG